MTDEHIIKQCKMGNEHAFELLITRYHQHLYNFIHNYTEDDQLTQDIVQETFIKMINNIQKYENNTTSKFSTWLFKIARNTITDEFRKRKIRQTVPLEDYIQETNLNDESVEEKVIRNYSKEVLGQAIDKLAPELKAVIHLRYYMDLSYKEISKILSSPPETVKWRLRYALDKIRKIIGTREVKSDEI